MLTFRVLAPAKHLRIRLVRGAKSFQQTHGIVLALAAISAFNKNSPAAVEAMMEGHSSAQGQYRVFSSDSEPHDEVAKAHAAAAGVANASVSPKPTIFTKILNKEIPADIVYEDDKVAKVT